jgi:hypothetical protein
MILFLFSYNMKSKTYSNTEGSYTIFNSRLPLIKNGDTDGSSAPIFIKFKTN